jgi:hypothetical protein
MMLASYALAEDADALNVTDLPDDWSSEANVTGWVHDTASFVLGRPLDQSANLFEQGYDRQVKLHVHQISLSHLSSSLTTTLLRRRLASALRDVKDAAGTALSEFVGQDFVYANPTIAQIGRRVAGLASSSIPPHMS